MSPDDAEFYYPLVVQKIAICLTDAKSPEDFSNLATHRRISVLNRAKKIAADLLNDRKIINIFSDRKKMNESHKDHNPEEHMSL